MRFRELQVMSLKGISWWLPERKWKSLSHVQLFATPWTVAHQLLHPWDSPARILEWVAISFSQGSSWPRDWTQGLPRCRLIVYHLCHQGSPWWLPGRHQSSVSAVRRVPDSAWIRADWDPERPKSNLQLFKLHNIRPSSPNVEVPIWAQGTVESARSKRSQRGHHVRMREVWEGVGVVKGYGRAEPGSPPPHPTQLSWITSLTHFFIAQRVQRSVGHAGKL